MGPVAAYWASNLCHQAQRINPLHRIRRIRIQVQATRIADRVFADKSSGLWIIVPIPIVVQPCFVIVVLALKTNRIGQSFLPCPFRALFFDFPPRFVLRAPGDLASVVGQFLWRAQVVALVPRQYVYRQRLRGVRPQPVFIDVVGTGVTRLGQQAHRLVAQVALKCWPNASWCFSGSNKSNDPLSRTLLRCLLNNGFKINTVMSIS